MAAAIHWVSALLIAVLLISGFLLSNMADPGAKIALLRAHAIGGIALLILTLLRIGWWQFADRKPEPVPGTSRLQSRSASVVHSLFHAIIVGMVVSGIGMMALSGAAAIVFGGAPGPAPDFWTYRPRVPHRIGAWLMLSLLVMHVSAALYHQFVKGDRILARFRFSD